MRVDNRVESESEKGGEAKKSTLFRRVEQKIGTYIVDFFFSYTIYGTGRTFMPSM